MDGTDYEIKFINTRGELVLLYVVQCLSDGDAEQYLRDIARDRFEKYELWNGLRLVSSGEATQRSA